MQIIIAQSHLEDYVTIRSIIYLLEKQGKDCNFIKVVNETHSVSKFAETNSPNPVLIICGQVFGFSASGTEIAPSIKESNSEAIFVLYSVMPEPCEEVDGYFPKAGCGDHYNLIGFLKAIPENANRETILTLLRKVPGFRETL